MPALPTPESPPSSFVVALFLDPAFLDFALGAADGDGGVSSSPLFSSFCFACAAFFLASASCFLAAADFPSFGGKAEGLADGDVTIESFFFFGVIYSCNID